MSGRWSACKAWIVGLGLKGARNGVMRALFDDASERSMDVHPRPEKLIERAGCGRSMTYLVLGQLLDEGLIQRVPSPPGIKVPTYRFCVGAVAAPAPRRGRPPKQSIEPGESNDFRGETRKRLDSVSPMISPETRSQPRKTLRDRPMDSPTLLRRAAYAPETGREGASKEEVSTPSQPPPEPAMEGSAAGQAPRSAKAELFDTGVATVARLTGTSPEKARSVVAGMLKATRNDYGTVLAIIRDPGPADAVDPKRWLMAAAQRAGAPTKPRMTWDTMPEDERLIFDDILDVLEIGSGLFPDFPQVVFDLLQAGFGGELLVEAARAVRRNRVFTERERGFPRYFAGAVRRIARERGDDARHSHHPHAGEPVDA